MLGVHSQGCDQISQSLTPVTLFGHVEGAQFPHHSYSVFQRPLSCSGANNAEKRGYRSWKDGNKIFQGRLNWLFQTWSCLNQHFRTVVWRGWDNPWRTSQQKWNIQGNPFSERRNPMGTSQTPCRFWPWTCSWVGEKTEVTSCNGDQTTFSLQTLEKLIPGPMGKC